MSFSQLQDSLFETGQPTATVSICQILLFLFFSAFYQIFIIFCLLVAFGGLNFSLPHEIDARHCSAVIASTFRRGREGDRLLQVARP
jgi:hypothetical protein